MQHTLTKYAVHKEGTTQFGYMCSFKEEAEQMLSDLKKEILQMPRDEVNKYHVVEVTFVWDE